MGKVIDPIENVRAFAYAYVVDVLRKWAYFLNSG
jgi:hypothetical protein